MKSFKDFNIKPSTKLLVGDKIKIAKIMNCEIIINDFSVSESQYSKNKSGKLLTLQIEFKNEPHIVFTGSDVLLDLITQVPLDDFPFTATITQIGDHFEFI